MCQIALVIFGDFWYYIIIVHIVGGQFAYFALAPI